MASASVVRALVFSVRNTALVSSRRSENRAHLAPTSNVRLFSGSSAAVAVFITRPSADGLNGVPTAAYTLAAALGFYSTPARAVREVAARADTVPGAGAASGGPRRAGG